MKGVKGVKGVNELREWTNVAYDRPCGEGGASGKRVDEGDGRGGRRLDCVWGCNGTQGICVTGAGWGGATKLSSLDPRD